MTKNNISTENSPRKSIWQRITEIGCVTGILANVIALGQIKVPFHHVSSLALSLQDLSIHIIILLSFILIFLWKREFSQQIFNDVSRILIKSKILAISFIISCLLLSTAYMQLLWTEVKLARYKLGPYSFLKLEERGEHLLASDRALALSENARWKHLSSQFQYCSQVNLQYNAIVNELKKHVALGRTTNNNPDSLELARFGNYLSSNEVVFSDTKSLFKRDPIEHAQFYPHLAQLERENQFRNLKWRFKRQPAPLSPTEETHIAKMTSIIFTIFND